MEKRELLQQINNSERIILRYTNYDDLDINEELEKIEYCDMAAVEVDQNNKKCLFILGMLFANGVKIDILNERDLEINKEGKSFSKMTFVWNRLGLESFTNDRFDLGKKIVDAREAGTKVERIVDNPIENKIFLICPVRNATPEQKQWIEDFVAERQNNNYIVHAPHLHTNQIDPLGGYNICRQNAEAVASSSEIDVYYDQTSTGSVFDLGVAYALHKPLKLLNKEEIVFNDEDLIDQTIINWPYNEDAKVKSLTNR